MQGIFIPSVVCLVLQRNPIRLRAGLRIPARATGFLQNLLPDYGAHPTFRQGENDGVMKLVIYLHLAPRLQMNGAVPQLPPYASMVRTVKTLSSLCFSK